MATGTIPNPSSGRPAGKAAGKYVEYDQYIDEQLRKTRSQVRGVDIAAGLMLLAAGALLYFLLGALVDHWLVGGGLGFFGRLLFCAAFVTAGVYYFCTQILPLFLRRINPVYAADAIERSKPTLKNSLVNFLMLRANPAGLPDAVYRAVEEQAATSLSRVPIEGAVDRSKLIKIGYVLLGVLLASAVYKIVSPKDPLRSVGRILLPWADIQPATRVTISTIEPEDAQAFRGQAVSVSAEVRGLRPDELVKLIFSTADGQTVEQPIAMLAGEGSLRYACVVPNESGMQQDLEYVIRAGDATSKKYRLAVIAAPTMVVESVHYDYPEYTGFLPQDTAHQGDLKGLEGTQVTLHALANQDIKSAAIDFDCDGTLDQPLTVDGTRASGKFVLALKEDRKTPLYANYRLVFRNAEGQENPQPIQHSIEVTPDLPPEIELLTPKQDEVLVAQDGTLDLEINAKDADFALRQVIVNVTHQGRSVLQKGLLKEPWQGQFVGRLRLDMRKLKLKAGEKAEYWAAADDSKLPGPNHVETTKRLIRIVSAAEAPPRDQPNADRPEQDDGEQGDGQPDDPQADKPQDKPGQAGDKHGKQKPPDAADKKQDNPAEPNEGDPKADSSDDANGQGKPDSKQKARSGKEPKADPASKSGESAKPDEPQAPANDQPVASDGSQDADAIQKILNDRQQKESQAKEAQPKEPQPDKPGQQGEGSAEQPKTSPGDSAKSNPKSGDEARPGQKPKQAAKPEPGSKEPNDPNREADNPDPQAGDTPQGDKSGPHKPIKQSEGQDAPGGAQDKPKPGSKQNQDRAGNEKSEPSETGDAQQPGGPQTGGKSADPKNPDPKAQHNPGEKPRGDKPGKKPQGEPKNQPQQPADNAAQGGDEQGGQPGGGGENPAPDQGDQQRGKPTGGNSKKPASKSGDKPGQPDESAGGQPQGSEPADDPQAGSKGATQSGEKPPAKNKQPGDQSANGQKQPGEQGNSRQKPGDEPGKKLEGPSRPGEKPAGGDKSGESPAGAKSDQQRPNQPKPGKPAPGEQGTGEKADQPKSDPENSGSDPGSKAGKGGAAKGNTPQTKPKPAGEAEKPDAKGGDPEDEKGDSGAGQGSDDKQGSPSPQGANQQRKKTQKSGAGNEDKADDAPKSPSNSEKQSDSKGGEDGDRSGGGKRGAGQKANKPGTGGDGQNTAADQGSGKSDQSGPGEASNRPGGSDEAQGKTGQSGDKAGQGSSSKRSSSGQASRGPGGKTGEGTAGTPQGGGGQQTGEAASQAAEDTPGEEANLEYSRKATDLALAHLRDQMEKGDPDHLLDKLGWTKEDAQRRFLERWEKMQADARSSGAKGQAARRELDDSLRSLGLKPRATALRSNAARDDQSHGLKESRRTSPPAEYAEQYKAYTQGAARGGK